VDNAEATGAVDRKRCDWYCENEANAI